MGKVDGNWQQLVFIYCHLIWSVKESYPVTRITFFSPSTRHWCVPTLIATQICWDFVIETSLGHPEITFFDIFCETHGWCSCRDVFLSEPITVSQRQMGEMLLILRLLSGREVAITINQVPSVVAVVSETPATRSECVCVLYTIYLRSYIYIYIHIYIYIYIWIYL